MSVFKYKMIYPESMKLFFFFLFYQTVVFQTQHTGLITSDGNEIFQCWVETFLLLIFSPYHELTERQMKGIKIFLKNARSHRCLSGTSEFNRKQQDRSTSYYCQCAFQEFSSTWARNCLSSCLLVIQQIWLFLLSPLMNLYQVHLLPLSILNICMNLFDKFWN